MGYTTEFEGHFEFNKPVDAKLRKYINNFKDTRRMKRDNEVIKEIYPDWKKKCLNGELGKNGEFFVNNDGDFGQMHDKSIINYNCPPSTQPSLWCQWEITKDGKYLQWDGAEKFYNYVEWLRYMINNFFKPNGYVLNGAINYQGEDMDDFGVIHVIDNVISLDETPTKGQNYYF